MTMHYSIHTVLLYYYMYCMSINVGNLLVVPVVKMIGLTMGLTVWGVTNMLNGWFQGRYA